MDSFPIRLSYSTMSTLHSCERKFQLTKMAPPPARESSPAMAFGTAFGLGLQHYLTFQDKERALYEAYMAFPVDMSDEMKGRTDAHLLTLLEASIERADVLLQEWEVATFKTMDGVVRKATELSFRINISPSLYYVGYVDVVMRNKITGQYAVVEVKTTGMNLLDLTPMYQNSGQALGYSIVLDKIVGEEASKYSTIYFVGQLNKKYAHKIHVMEFPKTLVDRLDWLITLGMDCDKIEEMRKTGMFPMRGGSCLAYNRPCQHFGVCQLHTFDQEFVPEEDTTTYDFHFDLDDIAEDHIKRI